MDKSVKTRLRTFINDDACYKKYKENSRMKMNEYEKYSVRLCKDIEEFLDYNDELERFAIKVGRAMSKKNIDN